MHAQHGDARAHVLESAVAPVEKSADLPRQRPAGEAAPQGAGKLVLGEVAPAIAVGATVHGPWVRAAFQERRRSSSAPHGSQAAGPRGPPCRAQAAGGQPRVRRDAAQRTEDGHAGQPSSAHAVRPERELAADAAQTAFGDVVVHGNGRVAHEHGQTVAVTRQGIQGAALRRTLRERVSRLVRRREERFDEPCELSLSRASFR